MIASLHSLNDIVFLEGKFNRQVLYEGEAGVLAHIAIPAGLPMPRHTSPVSAWLQVISGKVEVTLDNETHIVNPGQLLHLPAGNPHALHPVEDSIVVVTKFTNA